MTNKDIIAIAVLVEFADGSIHQVQIDKKNYNQHLMWIDIIESGIRVLDNDLSHSIILEQKL